jgi:hypothetical protein
MTNAEYGATPKQTPHSAVHHNVWIVIADKTEARILFKNNREFDVLTSIQVDTHRNGELETDVALFLENGLATREFSELVLVAPAPIMGQIRKALSSNILKTLVAQSDKNLMNIAGHQLRKELLSIAPGPDQL